MATAKKKSSTKAQKARTATAAPSVPPSKVYLLRTSDKDGKSHGGFRWPKEGYVEAPDWNPEPTCGGGLHGLPWGDGGWELLDATDYTRIWQVLEADAQDVVSIDGRKSKARCGNVIYSGNMADAMAKVLACQWRIDEIVAVALADKAANTSSGNYSKAASSGNSSTAASSGNSSTAASSGNYSKAASSGDSSTAASSGDSSKAASSGDYSTSASSGNYSMSASSGDGSTSASSGVCSKSASSGENTIAMAAGTRCTVQAGKNGCFASCYYDEHSKRNRILVGYVGEDGILPDTPYTIVGGAWKAVAQ